MTTQNKKVGDKWLATCPECEQDEDFVNFRRLCDSFEEAITECINHATFHSYVKKYRSAIKTEWT